jgi:hypothetical protein
MSHWVDDRENFFLVQQDLKYSEENNFKTHSLRSYYWRIRVWILEPVLSEGKVITGTSRRGLCAVLGHPEWPMVCCPSVRNSSPRLRPHPSVPASHRDWETGSHALPCDGLGTSSASHYTYRHKELKVTWRKTRAKTRRKTLYLFNVTERL